MPTILAISGSLRQASSNGAVLRAAQQLAREQFAPQPLGLHPLPAGALALTCDDHIGRLPLFNPDLDGTTPPAPVTAFRTALRHADAVLICSPEYAHGVPGALKNALDWIVSSGEFLDKPVGLLNASPHAVHAPASLAETLTVMMARLIPGACVTLPLTSNRLTDAQLAADPAIAPLLIQALQALHAAIEPPPAHPSGG